MILMIDKQWFVDRLADRNRSQRALARYMGLDASAITHILNGKRHLRLEEAEQISSFIGEPVDAVLKHAGVKLSGSGSTFSVPLIGIVDDIGAVTLQENLYIQVESASMAKLAAIQVRSSSAGALDGALIFFNPNDRYPPDIMVGKPSVITLQDNRIIIGILRRGLSVGIFDITYIGHQIEDQKASSAAPIQWIKP
jgi:transcriptional regulator with XRE-family HTH domain